MGCCASSNRSSYSPSSPTITTDSQPSRSSISQLKASENRAPPPLEEESVKEVLSEIPKWKPIVPKFEAEKPIFEKVEREGKPFFKADEISEVSEVCSLSESMSTITDRRDDEEEEMRVRGNGSPAKMRKNRSFTGDRRERTAGNSPAKRSDQSPAKRLNQSPAKRNVGSARGFQSRDQMGNMGTRNQPHRRDAGENSGRRSRSPATRTDNGTTRSIVGRSPSARRTNQSPARDRTTAPENGGRKVENSTMEGKWPSTTANESLENPLVSLECFIFL